MRTLSRLFILLISLTFVACEADELERTYSDDTIQIVGRAVRFTKKDVDSRVGATEGDIHNLSLFLFDSSNKLVDYQRKEGSNPVFTIDRASYKTPIDYDMSNAKLCMVANYPAYASKSDAPQTLDDLNAVTVSAFPVIQEIPDAGFPMVGSLPNAEITQLNLETDGTLPKKVLQIPLINLYSKMAFTLKLDVEQSTGYVVPLFQLDSWSVYNMPKSVCLGEETETSNSTQPKYAPFTFHQVTGTNPIVNKSSVTFSFYVPEHKLIPDNPVTNYGTMGDDDKQKLKPLHVSEGETPVYVYLVGTYYDHQGHRYPVNYKIYLGENNYDDFNIKRNVQYNNNVTIKGITNSNPGTAYDPSNNTVSFDYRVNVEKEVFSFYVERETLLDSHFEIRPLDIDFEKDSKQYDQNAYVELVIMKKTGNDYVEPGADETNLVEANWLRFENINDIADKSEDHLWTDRFYGKRKYFTTDLVTSKLNKTMNIRTIIKHTGNTKGSKRVWVYFDENTAGSDGTREAVIRAKFYENNSATEPDKVLDYYFVQRNLFPVSYTDTESDPKVTYDYLIEYFEEYLYNFDPKDKYGNTTDGMKWGLENVPLSNKHDAIFLTSLENDDWGIIDFIRKIIVSYIAGQIKPLRIYYDFYLPNDHTEADTHNRKGYEFCQEIIQTVNGYDGKDGSPDFSQHHIGKLDLGTDPKSAIEYCYNKNKRSDDGTIQEVHWYLPSIDQIEDITIAAHNQFTVFQNKYYWASQPAYQRHRFTYDGRIYDVTEPYMTDDAGYDKNNAIVHPGRARATKVLWDPVQETFHKALSGVPETYYSGTNVLSSGGDSSDYQENESNVTDDKKYQEGNKSRTDINRIRCVYKR